MWIHLKADNYTWPLHQHPIFFWRWPASYYIATLLKWYKKIGLRSYSKTTLCSLVKKNRVRRFSANYHRFETILVIKNGSENTSITLYASLKQLHSSRRRKKRVEKGFGVDLCHLNMYIYLASIYLVVDVQKKLVEWPSVISAKGMHMLRVKCEIAALHKIPKRFRQYWINFALRILFLTH
jgi:hypothetical protein